MVVAYCGSQELGIAGLATPTASISFLVKLESDGDIARLLVLETKGKQLETVTIRDSK